MRPSVVEARVRSARLCESMALACAWNGETAAQKGLEGYRGPSAWFYDAARFQVDAREAWVLAVAALAGWASS